MGSNIHGISCTANNYLKQAWNDIKNEYEKNQTYSITLFENTLVCFMRLYNELRRKVNEEDTPCLECESLEKEFEEMQNDNDLSLFIKEVKNLEDIENIKNIKSISNANIVCLIDSGLFMFELLEFNPLAFIRSANINADLDELINRIEYLNKGLGVMLEFQCGYQTVRMNVKNITYVESYAHYLLIHTLNSTVKVREKISVALQKLEPFGFIQVHRSYVINHDRIKKIDTDNITLSDETIIPIGKKYKQALKNH